jgi:CubicO group peptidase (beta-lactamase class C family)
MSLRRPRFAVAAALALSLPLRAQDPGFERQVDSIFSRFTTSTPGCTVGAARGGRPLLLKGYGMANLEYAVPLGAGSVMESGSVAKQFTSAALLLLQQDGKLSLDDDVREYLPEVPDFGSPITIRMMLTHTSGLRDQWGLLSAMGNPPTTQVHSLPLILHLVSRQRELNFPPGSEYLYSNTGYALAAMIVQRVSGKTLAAFSKERLFGPLGMIATQWRDDYARIVPGRATAYELRGSTYFQLMPFTNVYGNGGLLTTMADLMAWNEALSAGTIPGGKALVDALETRGRLTGGQTISYSLGLQHGAWNGHREVAHSGSTAGYQTYLTRFPDARVSIAVFCNVASANPTALTYQVASLLLPVTAARGAATDATVASVDSIVLRALSGRYRSPETDAVLSVTVGKAGLEVNGGPVRARGAAFVGGNGATLRFDGEAKPRRLTLVDRDSVATTYVEVVPPATSALRLDDFVGAYRSPELEITYRIELVDGQLALVVPPSPNQALMPFYEDGFALNGGRSLRFSRDSSGRVAGFRLMAGRVRNLRFDRVN